MWRRRWRMRKGAGARWRGIAMTGGWRSTTMRPNGRCGPWRSGAIMHSPRLCASVHNRKNYLFARSDTRGQRAAAIYTLIGSAKLNGVDPAAYLRFVLKRIADHPINRSTGLPSCCRGMSICLRRIRTDRPLDSGHGISTRRSRQDG